MTCFVAPGYCSVVFVVWMLDVLRVFGYDVVGWFAVWVLCA